MDTWLDHGTIFHGQLYVLVVEENGVWRVDDLTTQLIAECDSD